MGLSAVRLGHAPATAEQTEEVTSNSDPFFSDEELVRIRAEPGAVVSVYRDEHDRFIQSLGTAFVDQEEAHVRAGFCGILAHELVPYGRLGGSAAAPLSVLINRASTDCDNYVAIAWRLYDILHPHRDIQVVAMGVEGGPLGNHAQMLIHRPGGTTWLIDPTVGILQCGFDFDWILSGSPCSVSKFKSFFQAARGPEIRWLHDAVARALRFGGYRPSHLLYYAANLDIFLDPGPREYWLTPQAVATR
jgi:hypothetical protein